MITEFTLKRTTHIIALDLATTFGYSIFKVSENSIEFVESNAYNLGGVKSGQLKNKYMELCRRCQLLEGFIETFFNRCGDTQIILTKEAATFGPRVGGWTKTVQSAFDLVFYGVAYENDPSMMLQSSAAAIKKWGTGNGQLAKNKPLMVERADSILSSLNAGKQVVDDNEADAVILGHLTAQFIQYLIQNAFVFDDSDEARLAKLFEKFRKSYTSLAPWDSI